MAGSVTVIPDKRKTEPRDIINLILSLSSAAERRKIEKAEAKRKAAVDKSLGDYRVGMLRAEFQKIEAAKISNTAKARAEAQDAMVKARQQAFSNQLSLAGVLKSKVDTDRAALAPGSPETMETRSASLALNAVIGQLQGRSEDEIALQNLTTDIYTKPEDKMSESDKVQLIAQYGGLARDPSAFQAFAQEQLGVSIPDVKLPYEVKDWEERQKSSAALVMNLLKEGTMLPADADLALKSIDSDKGIPWMDIALQEPADRPMDALMFQKALLLQDTLAGKRLMIEDQMSKLNPGSEYRYIDTNPGFGTDINLVEYKDAKKLFDAKKLDKSEIDKYEMQTGIKKTKTVGGFEH